MNAAVDTTNDDARLHAAYVDKVNALVGAGRDGLAHELAEAYRDESGTARRSAAPVASRIGRSWLRRFDSYTLEVFNPGPPFRSRPGRSV